MAVSDLWFGGALQKCRRAWRRWCAESAGLSRPARGANVRLAGFQRPGDAELVGDPRAWAPANQVDERWRKKNRVLGGRVRARHSHPPGGETQHQRLIRALKVRSRWRRRAVREDGHRDLGWLPAVVASVGLRQQRAGEFGWHQSLWPCPRVELRALASPRLLAGFAPRRVVLGRADLDHRLYVPDGDAWAVGPRGKLVDRSLEFASHPPPAPPGADAHGTIQALHCLTVAGTVSSTCASIIGLLRGARCRGSPGEACGVCLLDSVGDLACGFGDLAERLRDGHQAGSG